MSEPMLDAKRDYEAYRETGCKPHLLLNCSECLRDAELKRLIEMEDRLKHALAHGDTWTGKRLVFVSASAVAFLRWIWTGEE